MLRTQMSTAPVQQQHDDDFISRAHQISDYPQTEPVPEYTFARISFLGNWFPQLDPSQKRSQTISQKLARRETLLLTTAIIATLILALNITVLAELWARYYPASYADGTLVFHIGSCNDVKTINIALHLAVNVISSVLYLSSQLCVQLITAPTRKQVDEAHRRQDWYDIGILSWRNFIRSRWRSKIICIILLGTSFPLHFM